MGGASGGRTELVAGLLRPGPKLEAVARGKVQQCQESQGLHRHLLSSQGSPRSCAAGFKLGASGAVGGEWEGGTLKGVRR